MKPHKSVLIVGLGWVGRALLYAIRHSTNYSVDCYDPKIKDIKRTHYSSYLFEGNSAPWLYDDPSKLEAGYDIIYVCVGTPVSADGSSTDLSQIEAVRDMFKAYPHIIGPKTYLINKSTVPVGTTMWAFGEWESQLIFMPEFLSEGTEFFDLVEPNRVVIGKSNKFNLPLDDDPLRTTCVWNVYTDNVFITDINTAEMCKYASNVMLALRVAFINGLADVGHHFNTNINDIEQILRADPRIGHLYLNSSVGYGGECLPKDVLSFGEQIQHKGNDGFATLVQSIHHANHDHIASIAQQVMDTIESKRLSKNIIVMGVGFKPKVGDVRHSPAIDVATILTSNGYTIQLVNDVAVPGRSDIIPIHQFSTANVDDLSPIVLLSNSPELLRFCKQYEGYIVDPMRYVNTSN